MYYIKGVMGFVAYIGPKPIFMFKGDAMGVTGFYNNGIIVEETEAYILLENELLSRYTSFKIGGPARLLYKIKDAGCIYGIIEALKQKNIKYMVIGNGSNILFSDKGYDGAVIVIGQLMQGIEPGEDETTLCVKAGTLLSKVSYYAMEHGLTGLEFASGIPGTIGGAVVMNAGAYGGEMKDVIYSVDILEPSGEIVTYSCEQMGFGYRKSIVDSSKIVVSVCIKLKKGDKADISEEMMRLSQARREKQPLEYPSAGSTFKRPEGYFAGKLIEDSGLKGYKVGGAMVSDKHCGFVVNYDNASFDDVDRLIEDVIRTVKERFDVELEPEVRIVR